MNYSVSMTKNGRFAVYCGGRKLRVFNTEPEAWLFIKARLAGQV